MFYSQNDLPEDTCQQLMELPVGRQAVSLTLQRQPEPECSSSLGSVFQSVAAVPADVLEDVGTYMEDLYADICPVISTPQQMTMTSNIQ